MQALFIAAGLALLIGLSLGLLGGGGSILTVPILVYVVGMEPKSGIATSLFVVGITSIAATVLHARRGQVRFRTGFVFGLGGMAGAWLGGWVGRGLPSSLLMWGFTLLMALTGAAMLRKRTAPAGAKALLLPTEVPVTRILPLGVVVGSLTGLFGAGGGFVIVPALTLLGGLPMAAAVGTSLLVVSMSSLAGFAGYMGHVHMDWPVAAVVTAFAVVGSLAGGALAGRIHPDRLRKVFGIFLLAMVVVLAGRQLLAGFEDFPTVPAAPAM